VTQRYIAHTKRTHEIKGAPCLRERNASSLLFVRLGVSSSGMFVCKFAMLVSRSCVLFGLFVLAERVVMLGLMMMCRGVMVSGR
jgi:hypothetical protein